MKDSTRILVSKWLKAAPYEIVAIFGMSISAIIAIGSFVLLKDFLRECIFGDGSRLVSMVMLGFILTLYQVIWGTLISLVQRDEGYFWARCLSVLSPIGILLFGILVLLSFIYVVCVKRRIIPWLWRRWVDVQR